MKEKKRKKKKKRKKYKKEAIIWDWRSATMTQAGVGQWPKAQCDQLMMMQLPRWLMAPCRNVLQTERGSNQRNWRDQWGKKATDAQWDDNRWKSTHGRRILCPSSVGLLICYLCSFVCLLICYLCQFVCLIIWYLCLFVFLLICFLCSFVCLLF